MESTNLLHDRLHDLDLALQVNDHDQALRHARDLRAGADGICMRLMPIVIEEWEMLSQTLPAEVSQTNRASLSEYRSSLEQYREVANG
jgi:hypothetical protein